jgi:glycosyltransferase involved in cell wall biosynthesis
MNKIMRIPKTIFTIYVQSRKSDYIFVNGLFIESAIANLFLKRPLIAKVVGDTVWERLQNKNIKNNSHLNFDITHHGVLPRFHRILFTWALNRFDVISCPSAGLEKLMHNWGVKPKIVIIKNGTQCLPNLAHKNVYDVISLSRLVKWKNVDSLIMACAGTNIRIAIAGDGPEELHLKSIAKRHKVNATFLGQVSQSEVPRLLGSGTIFALLSDYEGLSFSLIQAMMAKNRIIVSNAEGNCDVITNKFTGLVVNPKNEEEIRSALQILLKNSNENSIMARNARKVAEEKFCEERQLQKMVKLIQSIGLKN